MENGILNSRDKNLEKIAKKNGIAEKIIVDVVDEEISSVDSIGDEEMERYNKEYEEFLKNGNASVPIFPVNEVMVTNIKDYLKFSTDNIPSMVYYSEKLKIPLLTLKRGGEIRPHSDSTGIYYVLRGEGTIRIGMKNYAVTEGSIILVPKGVVRSISTEEGLTLMAIHITE